MLLLGTVSAGALIFDFPPPVLSEISPSLKYTSYIVFLKTVKIDQGTYFVASSDVFWCTCHILLYVSCVSA